MSDIIISVPFYGVGNCARCGARIGIAPHGNISCCSCGAPSPLVMGSSQHLECDDLFGRIPVSLDRADYCFENHITLYWAPGSYRQAWEKRQESLKNILHDHSLSDAEEANGMYEAVYDHIRYCEEGLARL